MIYLIRSSFSKNLRKKCPDISEKPQKHRKIRKSENRKSKNWKSKIEHRTKLFFWGGGGESVTTHLTTSDSSFWARRSSLQKTSPKCYPERASTTRIDHRCSRKTRFRTKRFFRGGGERQSFPTHLTTWDNSSWARRSSLQKTSLKIDTICSSSCRVLEGSAWCRTP